MRLARRIADLTLSLGAVLGIVCVLAAFVGPLAGLRPMFVRSGSMAPAIGTGSLVVAHRVPVDEVQVGDVVSMTTPEGSRVTHRVVERGAAGLVLRGDANATVDPGSYAGPTADRVFAHVPGLGYAVGWASSPLGVVVLGLVGCVLLGLVILPRAERRTPGRRRARIPVGPSRRAAAGGAVALLVGFAILGPGQVRPGWAAPWTDPVPITGSSYGAVTLPTTTVACGILQVLTTSLTWTAAAGATGYRLHYGAGGATTETVGSGVTSKAFNTVGSGTFWVETLRSFGPNDWVSAISNKKAYTVVLTLVGTCTDA